MIRFGATALATLCTVASIGGLASHVHAQEAPTAPEAESAPTVEDYPAYRPVAPRVIAPTPAQLKAQARGEQRMARLEALRWYGFSNSRPTASAMPWTTMYSPAWQRPGGRPFAWYVSDRPVVIQVAPREVYR
jgi:hypothetical protein